MSTETPEGLTLVSPYIILIQTDAETAQRVRATLDSEVAVIVDGMFEVVPIEVQPQPKGESA